MILIIKGLILIGILEFGFPANGVVCQETCYKINVERKADKYGNWIYEGIE